MIRIISIISEHHVRAAADGRREDVDVELVAEAQDGPELAERVREPLLLAGVDPHLVVPGYVEDPPELRADRGQRALEGPEGVGEVPGDDEHVVQEPIYVYIYIYI